jgi:hypothetical protein
MVAHRIYHCDCNRSLIGKLDPRRQFRRRCLRKGPDPEAEAGGAAGRAEAGPVASVVTSGARGIRAPFFISTSPRDLFPRTGQASRSSGKVSRAPAGFPGRREGLPFPGQDFPASVKVSRSLGRVAGLRASLPAPRAGFPGVEQSFPAIGRSSRLSGKLAGGQEVFPGDRERLAGRRATLPLSGKALPIAGRACKSSGTLPGSRESSPEGLFEN